MDKNFEELKYGINHILEGTSFHGERKAADALVSFWAQLRDEGVEARDFARAGLLVSECVMTCYETLPEILRFTEEMKATAEDKLDTLRENWPNIRNDDAVWPKGLHPDDKE